ncbi:hypothetical protein [Haladaptatus sp. NG-WS-4]
MVGTRGVLAILAGVTMSIAVVVIHSGRRETGLWLLTAGFFLASLWSGLSVVWAQTYPNRTTLSAESHLLLGTTAIAGVVYYGMLAREAVDR